MRTALAVTTLALLAAPLAAAQDPDPDNAVQGAGLPTGWMARADRGSLDNINFRTMGDGFHFTVGPAAIYWQASNTAEGNFTVSATLRQTTNPRHPEAYGLFVGGRNLQADTQTYYYFLVRKDGQFLVRQRVGSEVRSITNDGWTANSAVMAADSAGQQTNTLAVTQNNGTLELRINNTLVWSAPVPAAQTSGVYGYRVNHNLDVHAGPIQKRQGQSM